jgi:hypothetical protein
MSTLNNTPPNGAARKPKWRIGQQVWQWCSTRTALLLFLLPIIIALAASYALPQAPAHLYADSFRYQEWLSARQVEFRNWTQPLTTIGAFRIRETLWFRTLLALLLFVLLVSLGEQIRLLFDTEGMHKPSKLYTSANAASLASDLPYQQTVHHVQQTLGARAVHVEEQGTSCLYTDRHAWVRTSKVVIYLGLLLLSVGLAVQTRGGWRQSEIRVLPYEDVGIGPRGTLRVRLIGIEPPAQEGAEPSASTAHLQIAGQAVLPIQLGTPARHRGYRYLWVSKGGPSVQLSAYRVSDPERALVLYDYAIRPVAASSLQFSFASGQDPDRQFILPEDKIVGWLRWEDAGDAASQYNQEFHLWLFSEDGHELGVETFAAGQDASVLHAVAGGVDYRLEIARYIVLDIAYQPAQWALWVGGTLLGLGFLGQLIPRTQIWVQVRAVNEHAVVKVREQREGLGILAGSRQHSITTRLQAVLGRASLEHAATQQQAHAQPPEQNQLTHRNDQ